MIEQNKYRSIILFGLLSCFCVHISSADACADAHIPSFWNISIEQSALLFSEKENSGIAIIFGCFMGELITIGEAPTLPIVVLWEDGTIFWCPFLIQWNFTDRQKIDFSDIHFEALGCYVKKITRGDENATINRIASYRMKSPRLNQLRVGSRLIYTMIFKGHKQREVCIYSDVFPKESSKFLFVNIVDDNTDLYQDLNTLMDMSLSLCHRFEAVVHVQKFYPRLKYQLRIRKLAGSRERKRRIGNDLRLGAALCGRLDLSRQKWRKAVFVTRRKLECRGCNG